MSEALAEQPPRWLARSDARQPFVATLCSVGRVDATLARFYNEIGSMPMLERKSYNDHACAITLECEPAEAWSLLRKLRNRLPETDVYLQPKSSPRIRLLICDMDMTMVAAETLDEVAAQLGLGDVIAGITARAMNGEIDFNSALRERIAMLAGRPEQAFHDLAATIEFCPGAPELIATAKAAGLYCVLISGGFAQVAEPVAKRLGFDEVHCNQLVVVNGLLTGAVHRPIVNADYKLAVLQQVARQRGHGLAACCAIGDGANDLPMLRAAGLGIAYHGKPILQAATPCRIDATDLQSAACFMRL